MRGPCGRDRPARCSYRRSVLEPRSRLNREWTKIVLAFVTLLGGACVEPRRADSTASPQARDRFSEGIAYEMRGERIRAEASYRAAIDAAPSFVEAHRAYQNLKIAEGFHGQLRNEYRRRLEVDANDPIAIYLMGRLHSQVAAQHEACARAVAAAPDFYFGWIGLGHTAIELRDPRTATTAFEKAIELDPNRSEAWRGRLRQLERTLGDEARARAVDVAKKLRAIDPFDADATRVLAERAVEEKRRDDAVRDIVTLAIESADPTAANLLRDFFSRHAVDGDFERLRDIFAPFADARAGAADWRRVLAWLEERAGDPRAALALLDAFQGGNDPRDLRRMRRRLAITCGDFERALRDLIADRFESGFAIEDRTNELALRALLESPLREKRGDDATACIDSLNRNGLLELAIALGSELLREDPTNRELRDRVARSIAHRRFVAELLAFFERSYATLDGDQTGFDEFVRAVRRISRDCLGEDVVEPVVRREYVAIGSFLDPDPEHGSGLARYFERFGQFLVVGQRSLGGIDGYLLTQIASRRIEQGGKPVLRVLGEDLIIPSRIESKGGEIAGFALETFIVLNVDRARSAAERTRRAWNDRITADSSQPAALLDEIEIAASAAERIALDEPGSVVLRTLLRSYGAFLSNGGRPAEYDGSMLDAVEAHERAHIADAHEFLPLFDDVSRKVGILAENGFSGANVEAWLEGRAQLEALAAAADPRIALAELLRDLPSRVASPPHSAGYYDVAEQLVQLIDESRSALPEIDFSRVIVQQLDRLPPDRIRGLARLLLERER